MKKKMMPPTFGKPAATKPAKAGKGAPKMNPAPAPGKGKPFKAGGMVKGKC